MYLHLSLIISKIELIKSVFGLYKPFSGTTDFWLSSNNSRQSWISSALTSLENLSFAWNINIIYPGLTKSDQCKKASCCCIVFALFTKIALLFSFFNVLINQFLMKWLSNNWFEFLSKSDICSNKLTVIYVFDRSFLILMNTSNMLSKLKISDFICSIKKNEDEIKSWQ